MKLNGPINDSAPTPWEDKRDAQRCETPARAGGRENEMDGSHTEQ